MTRKTVIVSIVLAFLFLIQLPSFASQAKYPQIEIGGYKNWFYSKYNVSPIGNYEIALRDVLVPGDYTGGPWTEELRLYIAGDLLEDISVVYDLEQNSATMDWYNLYINYRNYSLIFGDPKDYFNGQEYILQDHISGIGAAAEWGKLRTMLFSGTYPGGWSTNLTSFKIFRNPQYNGEKAFSYFKDNPYLEYLSLDLGRVDINGDTIEVYLDGKKLINKLDFYFDNAYGLVLISSNFKDAKEARISYVLNNGEKKEEVFDFNKDAGRRAFLSPDFRIIDGSEIVTVDGARQERGLDYRANYSLGLFVMNQPIHDDAEVRIDYDYTYGAGLYDSETISNQAGTSFTLAHRYIIDDSESVVKNSQYLYTGADYSMNYNDGTINFVVPLTNSDTVEVSYTYKGIRQDVMGANAEYELSDWSKVGSSIVSISPSKSDEYLYDVMSPSSFLIWNLYNRTILNEDTYVKTEFALSSQNVDFRNSNTVEADSALKVFGKTRFGNLDLSGTYRKTGINFASVRKVKMGADWSEEEVGAAARYKLLDNLSVKMGVESDKEQIGASPEVNTAVTEYGFNYQPLQFWTIAYDYKMRMVGVNVPQLVEDRFYSQYFYSNLDIKELFPVVKGFSNDAELIFKYLRSDENGDAFSGGGVVVADTMTDRSELGWYHDFKGGFSSYILYKVENMKDNVSASSYDRLTPFYRISYLWEFGGGHNLEFYWDYSTAQQRGSTDYDKKETGLGIVWDIPTDNPILSEFKFSTLVRNSDYTDLNDSSNNYMMSEMEIAGSLVF